jgi:hypothetical protein
MDVGLQPLRRCMARHRGGRPIGMYMSWYSSFQSSLSFRYMLVTAISLPTLHHLPMIVQAGLATKPASICQLRILLTQTCSPQYPVCSTSFSIAPFSDAVPGWNLFVAAMTPNNDLRLDLIKRVHDRALLSGNQRLGAFPLQYNSKDGSDISVSGLGRRVTERSSLHDMLSMVVIFLASPAQGAMFAPLYGKFVSIIPAFHG